MSALDEIRKLEQKKSELLNAAKSEALERANAAIKDLRELGFNYRLAQNDDQNDTPRASGSRRTGIRSEVLDRIKQNPDGVTRAQLLDTMNARGDKSAEQSISNALAALKKAGTISGDNGTYRAA